MTSWPLSFHLKYLQCELILIVLYLHAGYEEFEWLLWFGHVLNWPDFCVCVLTWIHILTHTFWPSEPPPPQMKLVNPFYVWLSTHIDIFSASIGLWPSTRGVKWAKMYVTVLQRRVASLLGMTAQRQIFAPIFKSLSIQVWLFIIEEFACHGISSTLGAEPPFPSQWGGQDFTLSRAVVKRQGPRSPVINFVKTGSAYIQNGAIFFTLEIVEVFFFLGV